MIRNIFLFLTLCSSNSFGQFTISSTNSGAFSGVNFMYSVGEIYVEPETNSDDTNSGLMGILYQIEFSVSGIDEILQSDDFRVYPNPTCQVLHFNLNTKKRVESIHVYDIYGKLVLSSALREYKIDVSHLPAATYFIKTDNEKIDVLKIIKQ
jgi:hypothetical protein